MQQLQETAVLDTRAYYDRVHAYVDVKRQRLGDIEYMDVAPRPLNVQIPLVEYFERQRRLKADRWQRHFCQYLEDAAVGRVDGRTWALFHAQAQLGKTTILSQAYPAWLLGHDPLHRFALAMYNVSRSQTHSLVVIQLMQSKLHKDIFPDKDGWIHAGPGGKTSMEHWTTTARHDLNDGQYSFNPVGLQSGLTGSGFDTLVVDDPYKEAKEAFSAKVRENMATMWEYTMEPRASLHSNIFGMFHRYAPEDFAGYLLDNPEYDFDYVRYASECDGDYEHTKTGRRFPDPLARKNGELISERFGAAYYAKRRQNNRVWLSMFQGRPSTEEGEYFNVGRIKIISKAEGAERLRECLALVRAWDNAATPDNEAAAHSVGSKMGIRPGGKVTVFDVFRERLDTGARMQAQERTARADGSDVEVTIPRDPGAAGKDTVFFTKQMLKEFAVVEMLTSASKERRAEPYSYAVNVHDVEFVDGDWNAYAKQELRDFPLSEYKDVVDSMSDGYNRLYQIMVKGTIITSYKPQRNLLTYSQFAKLFPSRNAAGKLVLKVPDAWNIYAAVKTSSDASLPDCGIVVARASKNTGIEEALFILGEYKEYDNDYARLFDWLSNTLTTFCKRTDPENTTIWLHPDSKHFGPAIRQKLDVGIAEFKGDAWSGYPEMNWYFVPVGGEPHPFVGGEEAARMYGLIKPGTFVSPRDAAGNPAREGLYSLRQEIRTCGYNDKGEPAATCQLLDCLRMIVAGFSTSAASLSEQELYEQFLGPEGIVDADEEIDPARHAQIVEARRRARLRLRKLEYGDEYLDPEDLLLIEGYEQLGVKDAKEWATLDDEEQFYRQRDAILRALGEEE